ncbi:MAG: hypothetical protein IPH60_03105 [Flavobacteriales bacterium]|nr:hypothetical protein [Flavobacteriales bacterium]MBK7111426.1 hypothetical protein [Flavobacteriales bacterium]MBK7484217.1 hypothetical protein [Flavobacteriales bacterium]MBK8709180.1 hypothetical protein [Flavobacteriales bacterium]MBP9178000.1 hypothetical protein [Flavobacteriales bacterium]
MKQLSERVSVVREEERTSVVISARVGGGKEALLVTWFLAWLLIGVLVIRERTQVPVGDPMRQYLLAFLAFWLYFAVKVGRAVLWRLKGFELWRLKDGTFTIKDSMLGYGKASPYFIDNITELGLLAVDRTSWKYQLTDSFWTVGGERLGFEHLGKKVAFGKGLNDEEAKLLLVELKNALKRARKAQ